VRGRRGEQESQKTLPHHDGLPNLTCSEGGQRRLHREGRSKGGGESVELDGDWGGPDLDAVIWRLAGDDPTRAQGEWDRFGLGV